MTRRAGRSSGDQVRENLTCPASRRSANTWLSPKQARVHIRKLHHQGMSYTLIARRAQVSQTTVLSIVKNRRENLHSLTEAAILAVKPATTQRCGFVPAAGTRRRIRGLVALGYPIAGQARRLGRHIQQIWEWASDEQKTVAATTADMVAALFEELSATPAPPSRTATRARNAAARYGWLPPLVWDDIDDPGERPHNPKTRERGRTEPDHAALYLITTGPATVALNRVERRIAAAQMTAAGVEKAVIAERLGMSVDAVTQQRVREHRAAA